MSAPVTTFSRLWLLVPCVSLLLPIAVLLSGCSGKNAVDWQLEPSAQRIYHYLVLHEAIAADDPAMVQQSLESLMALEPNMQMFRDGAEYYLLGRRYAEARVLARQGLEYFSGEIAFYMIITESYVQERQYVEASDALLEFLAIKPEDAGALHELGRLYILMQRYADAEACLLRISEAGRGVAVRYLLAMALLGQDKIHQGERELRLVIMEDPEFTDAWVNLAVAAQAKGRMIQAANILEKGIEVNPNDHALRLRLVEAWITAKRPDLALSVAEEFTAATYRLESALLLLNGKAYAQTEKLLRDMLQNRTSPAEIYFYLAVIAYEYRGNIKEALALLEQIPQDSPLAERALPWKLDLLHESGELKAAEILAHKHLEARPDLPESYIMAALASQRNSDLNTAISLLRKGREKWFDHETLSYHLARFLYDAQQKEEAMRIMESVILMNPGHAPALNFVGYSLAEAGKDLDRALQLLSRAVMEEPLDAHIADSLAWAQYQAGSYQEAWATIRRSVALGGDHPVIWEHYGDIASKVGNKKEARNGYGNALRRKPDNPETIREKLRNL